MSNFNSYFKKKGAKIIVDKCLGTVDFWTKPKITELKFHVEEENHPATYYLENGLTAAFKVVVDYKIDDKDAYTTYFEVPKEVDGAFVIRGAYRIGTNMLDNDWDCKFNMSGKRQDIHFDYDRIYDINKGVLSITTRDPAAKQSVKVKTYKFDEIDAIHGLERENLKLTDRQVKKLMIKLDLDYTPYYISQKLIEDCIAFGDDKSRDLIIDKKINSVPAGFMKYLFRSKDNRVHKGITNKIATYLNKYGKLPEPINYISSPCEKYFKGTSDAVKGGDTITIATGINPLNMQSLRSKLQFPESVAYNSTFSDIICIGATPINGNVGKQNALTVSAHVTDDDLLFDVYDKDFNKITIPYIDYLNSKVVASECVDYDNNKIVPDEKGEVEVKYRMRRKKVPVEEIDLIDLHPDFRLSEEVRRIPFLNYSDSVRIHMGSNMLRQAIMLPEGERPLVDTGNVEELKDNVLNEKFRYESGKVKEINDQGVVIELPNKETTTVRRRAAIPSMNDVNIFTEPKVKVGQTVKKGDVIIGGVGVEKDTMKSGLNALVLFHAMFGYVNEDALVVSESFSKRMKSYSIIDVPIDLKYSDAVKWIAPIGTKVKSGDSLMTYHKAINVDTVNEAILGKLGGMLGQEGTINVEGLVKQLDLKVPNNIDEAYVSDFIVQKRRASKITKDKKIDFALTSKKVFDEYEKTKDRKPIYERFPGYVAADVLKPYEMSNLDDKSEYVVYVARVRLIKRTDVVIGSKITNRYGGKGVVSKVLPDNMMPVVVDPKTGKKTTVEVVMNPYSTINRKIPGVNMEAMLGNIAHRLHDIVEERKGDKKKRETILPLLEKYYPGRFSGMTTDEFIKYHEKNKLSEVYYFNVGSYSTKFTPDLLDEWSKELGVEPQSKILIPTEMITDLGELKANMSEEEFEKVKAKMKGKYTEVKKPLTVGYINLLQLYHIPIYSNKSTSSMFQQDIDEYKDSPIMGRGAYRQEGQKIGEMELSVYLSRNADKFLKSVRGDTYKVDNQTFLNNLLGLGLTVVDDKGYKQGGSSLKERLDGMKVKFRLKNQK